MRDRATCCKTLKRRRRLSSASVIRRWHRVQRVTRLASPWVPPRLTGITSSTLSRSMLPHARHRWPSCSFMRLRTRTEGRSEDDGEGLTRHANLAGSWVRQVRGAGAPNRVWGRAPRSTPEPSERLGPGGGNTPPRPVPRTASSGPASFPVSPGSSRPVYALQRALPVRATGILRGPLVVQPSARASRLSTRERCHSVATRLGRCRRDVSLRRRNPLSAAGSRGGRS
jgi:hypothetical protein